MGADAGGARREDARHGEGDARRRRDGPRVGRRPQHHRRREARRHRHRRRVQPGHGGAVEPLAAEAGVAGKATFVEGDMFTADISKATVMALFLLPDNLERLRDTFMNLRPGHADGHQHVRHSGLGSPTSARPSRATA